MTNKGKECTIHKILFITVISDAVSAADDIHKDFCHTSLQRGHPYFSVIRHSSQKGDLSENMKKKTKKTILISIVIAIVVICLIVLAVLLRKDVRGLTAFDRSKVIASAGGQSITMGEYAMGLDNTLSYYTQYYGASYTDEEIRTLQDNIVKQLLTQKLAVAKLDELGLSFTAEELAHFKQTAEDQLASLEESIGKQMATSGNFSNASLQTQINEYFTRQLGMSKAKYKSYVESQEKAEHALEKLQTYR